VPLPEYADAFVGQVMEGQAFGGGSLVDALLKSVRDKTQLDIKRADFKLEQLPQHLFMNFRVVDEHGRQLGTGRSLAGLKTELGGQARSAFQALAALRPGAAAAASAPAAQAAPGRGRAPGPVEAAPGPAAPPAEVQQYTDWTFGELPELMEVRRGAQTLVGFPALIDRAAHVVIEVFDEPDVAAAKHRAGLRRLVSLQLRDALKYLEKNIPDLQKMAALYMPLGSIDDLRGQIIDLALDRAFLADPLPTDGAAFRRRNEIARSVATVLAEYAAAVRKLKDSRAPKELHDDVQAQLGRLLPKRFVAATPWAQLAHLPRYLKAVTMRLDKWRGDPGRDTTRMAEMRPLEQRYLRLLAERKGVHDARLDEFRWQLEELRVSLYAQELRTPQPVSVKRLEKVWAQISV
jgi:ATP-dependent helicase HrpA